jgi:hypothetical protein
MAEKPWHRTGNNRTSTSTSDGASQPYYPPCPSCKETGKHTRSVEPIMFLGKGGHAHAAPIIFDVPCLDCAGMGRCTPLQLRAIKFRQEMWCKCTPGPGKAIQHQANSAKWDWCVPRTHIHCSRCWKIVHID